MSAPLERWLTLEGLHNVRDVGGLPLRTGGTTRSGVLLRSEALHYCTTGDVEHLVDVFGLKLVLDLRTQREIERGGPTAVADAGVETVALSFIPEYERPLPETDGVDPLVHIYLGYLSYRPQNVVEAVRRLAAVDAGPALVHCAAGKDRTGTLVALVLDAVGVERAAVVADYALSTERLEVMYQRRSTATGEPMPTDLAAHFPRAEAMTQVLATLDAEHGVAGTGGAAGWLLANGFDEESFARLRTRLTGA